MAINNDKQPEEQRKLDQALQPGGVYVVAGKVVNAEGKELEGWTVDADGNAVKVGGSGPKTVPESTL